jgi:hypothetical protein
MRDLAILLRQAMLPAHERLLGRAARARRIALMLSPADAAVAEAYARDCEAEAQRLELQRTPVAA